MRSLHFQRLLGSGAFGSVYLAELVGDRGFRRPLAVKVLLKDQTHGDMFLARVRDEARLLGMLQDDHILKVLELAKIDGRDAVLMEFVEGVDLAAIVEMGHRPPPRALAELGAAVAGALYRAHKAVHPSTGQSLNVIHRDVKPANVMVTDRGGVKLLDFGVARARFESRESYTGQFVLGTLNYMAPEYIVTGDVSPAADIYGLALTLWEAACGDIFGQPKLRRDLHETRVEERLEVISGTHGELVPLLRQMLAWDAAARPDGSTIERQFIASTDMLRGTGLRSWAAEAVPKALARERAAARDECGLLNRTFTLEDEEISSVAQRPAAVASNGAGPPVPPVKASSTRAPVLPDDPSELIRYRPAFLDDPASSPRTPAAPLVSVEVPAVERPAGSPGAGRPALEKPSSSPGKPTASPPEKPASKPASDAGKPASPSARPPSSPGAGRPAVSRATPAPERSAVTRRPKKASSSPLRLLVQGVLICGILGLLGVVVIVLIVVAGTLLG